MNVLASLRTVKMRSRELQVIRRHGKTLVISKSNPRFKARQG